MKKNFLKTNLGKYISFITYYLKSIFASLQSRLILSHRIISLIKIAFSEKRKKIRETKIYTMNVYTRVWGEKFVKSKHYFFHAQLCPIRFS